MKSIKTKIVCFLSFLAMVLVGTSASAQLTESKPDAETISAHLNTTDGQVLQTYLARQGYKSAGINDEGTVTYTDAEGTAPKNTVVVNTYRNATGASIDLYSSSETIDGRTQYVTRAEDAKYDYIVSGGVVNVAAKISINWQKVVDCFNKYLKPGVGACSDCLNCLKACIAAGGSNWKKLKCCLGCWKCYSCLFSIFKFFWCVF